MTKNRLIGALAVVNLAVVGACLAMLVWMCSSVIDLREGLARVELNQFHAAVDRAVDDAESDRQRCIRVARVMAMTMRGTPRDLIDQGPPGWWASRSGVCAERSMLMIKALRRYGIRGRLWNFYDYPFGHSCVQAWYDGGWHFFDPTYGGYFTGPDGEVLSWEQVQADPDSAVENMVVFEPGLDRPAFSEPAVDNRKRMRQQYAPDLIAEVENAGFCRSGRIFRIPVRLELPDDGDRLILGTVDGDSADLLARPVRDLARCRYLGALGQKVDNFAHVFHVEGLQRPGRVRLTFVFSGSNYGRARLLASAVGGEVLEGAEGPACGRVGEGRRWSVVCRFDTAEHAAIEVRLDRYEESLSFAKIDAVILERLP
jgi:hypothetical protein